MEQLKSYVPAEILVNADPKFFTDNGFRNWDRIPLVYPYSINTIGGIERSGGVLTRERFPTAGADRGTDIVNDISEFAFDGKVIIVRIGWDFDKARAIPFWAVLEFATAKEEQFESEAVAFAAARKVGYAGPDRLESIIVHYNRTWGIPGNR